MSATLVTAFYPIKSKFSAEKYIQWAKAFLRLECPIVLFTTQEYAPIFQTLRSDKPMHTIVIPFDELYMWKQYKDMWAAQHAIDHEKGYHTPELYAIWAQKAVFVEEAIMNNPFHTEYFFWCDIGAFRSPVPEEVRRSFPTTKHFPSNAVLFSSVNRLAVNDRVVQSDGIPGNFQHIDRIVGGLWGGNIRACLRWRSAYESMLNRYVSAGRFAGKDQSVMLSAYLEDPSLGVIVQPTVPTIDKWFFLEYLLSDMDVKYRLDDSYQRDPHLSILIPIYNGVEYLEECIRSVLAQTYTDYEVLIAVNGHGIDGGAVGVTAKKLAELDSRIRVVIQGPPIASKVESLNDVMSLARGEWICLLDCDDAWLPTKLEEQIAAKQTVARGAVVIGTFCVYFGSSTGSPRIPGGTIDSGIFATVNPIINSSSMIHRSLCEWRKEHEGLEDYDLWMRIALAGGRMYNIPKILTRHRIHADSAFNSRGLDPTPLRRRFRELLRHPATLIGK